MSCAIAFRADASTRIGSGHVRRCQSLAQALAGRGATLRFATRESDVAAAGLFDARPFEYCRLPDTLRSGPDLDSEPATAHADWLGTDWTTDADQTIAALSAQTVAAVVVDHYALDARWHERVAAALRCAIIVIDDLGDRALAADLIIDHNHAEDHRQKYAKVNRRRCDILGGPRYAMLDQGFAQATRNPAADPVRSVGIFMGGVDRNNLSERALRGLRDSAGFGGSVEIVSTRANPQLARLQAAVDGDRDARLTLDAPDLVDFFGRHELHIGAGGGATWERCCLGAPSIALMVADNQRQVLLPLARLKLLSLIEQELPSADLIGRHARALIEQPALRRELAANAMRLVDGGGCQRIADRVMTTCLQ